MVRCKFLAALLILISCKPTEIKWYIKKIDLNLSSYKKIVKYKNHLLGSNLIIQKNNISVYFISESNKLIKASLTEDKIDSFAIPIYKDIIGTYFGNDTIGLITQDTFYLYNIFGKYLDKYKSPLTYDNFIISSLYEQKIKKFNNYFYLQLGLKSNKLNYTDKNIFLFFNKDTTFNLLQYPSEYNSIYQQYSEIASTFNADFSYYIPATCNKLMSTNLKTLQKDSLTLNGKYIQFDTTRYTDILYIKNYTESTYYNYRIINTNKYIYLIRRTNIKRGKYKLEILAFDKKLKLIDKIIFKDKIDITNIVQFNNKIYLLNLSESKLIECSLN